MLLHNRPSDFVIQAINNMVHCSNSAGAGYKQFFFAWLCDALIGLSACAIFFL